MPKGRKQMKSIDTVPLPEYPGMTVKKGTIGLVRGRFVLEVGGSRREIPEGVAPAKVLKPLVGRAVSAVYSRAVRGALVAIGTWPTPERPRWILCYIPAPEIIRRLDAGIRSELLRGMVGEGIISEDFAREVRGAG